MGRDELFRDGGVTRCHPKAQPFTREELHFLRMASGNEEGFQ